MAIVLVIDDNPAVRGALRRVLEQAGNTVVLASNGLEGIAAFRQQQPDVVVIDIIMPEQEGISTIRQMLDEQPATKIVAISGGARIGNTDFLEIAKKFGAMVILRKPFDPEDLTGVIQTLIAGPSTQAPGGGGERS